MPDFSCQSAFSAVDHYKEGFIHADNLQEFFKKYYVFLEPSEIYAIVRRLDTDGDARIRYHEFEEFLRGFTSLFYDDNE